MKYLYTMLLLGLGLNHNYAAANGTMAILKQLKNIKVVDLSHKFDTDIPHWYGFDKATREVLYNYQTDGFKVTRLPTNLQLLDNMKLF